MDSGNRGLGRAPILGGMSSAVMLLEPRGRAERALAQGTGQRWDPRVTGNRALRYGVGFFPVQLQSLVGSKDPPALGADGRDLIIVHVRHPSDDSGRPHLRWGASLYLEPRNHSPAGSTRAQNLVPPFGCEVLRSVVGSSVEDERVVLHDPDLGPRPQLRGAAIEKAWDLKARGRDRQRVVAEPTPVPHRRGTCARP